ncbi:mCG140266, partial [Mus musculus]
CGPDLSHFLQKTSLCRVRTCMHPREQNADLFPDKCRENCKSTS